MQMESLTLTIEEVAAALGIGRTLAYDLARRDELPVPVLRLGRRLVVSRVALERTLGFGNVRERSGSASNAPEAA
jgi:excisionase family DNA binding protein